MLTNVLLFKVKEKKRKNPVLLVNLFKEYCTVTRLYFIEA